MTDAARWFPVTRSAEVGDRQIVQAQLLGQEIAVWRDVTGAVNAWENRCPHRGVRLSIGVNAGAELRCRYHGWRFAAGSGRCTLIPAHPTQKPAAGIGAAVYGSAESGGFVWAALEPGKNAPALPELPPRGTTVRSIHIAASAAAVSHALLQNYRLASGGASITALDEFVLLANPAAAAPLAAPADAAATFLLQPMTTAQTVIHGVVHAEYSAAERLAVCRAYNSRLSALRDALE